MDSEEINKWDEESERAWQYDEHNVEFASSIVSVLKEILSADAKILDAGCGIGKHVKAFAKLGYRVVGIDQSKQAVHYAQILNPNTPIFHIRILELMNNPSINSSLNLIHTCAVLQHSIHERKREILWVFHQALKPKGYLLCTECTFTPETLKLLKEHNPSVEFTDEWTDGYSFSEKGWIKFMAQNGFIHVKTIPPWPYYLFQVNK